MTFPPELPAEISVRAGRSVDLELPSYAAAATRGQSNLTTAPTSPTQVLEPLVNAPAGPPPQELGVTEPPALTLVPDRLTITGLTAGTTHCPLTLRRPFVPGPPAAQYDVHVTVLP